MLRLLRPMYRGIVKTIPHSIKHPVNVALIRGKKKLPGNWRQLYNRLIPPTHPIRERYLRQLHWWYQIKILQKEPILIYQMGKVGSSSIHASLIQFDLLPIHIHSLNIDWLLPYYAPRLQEVFKKRLGPNWHWIRRNVIETKKNTKIIILTRDPVAINISNFFHNLDLTVNIDNAHETLDMVEIIETYHEVRSLTYEYMSQWFDHELKRHLGVDVFTHNFDKTNGYCHIHHDPYDVLVLKLELSDQEKSNIIANFLNIPNFELVLRNVADKKSYAAAYRQFKEQVTIDSKILDEVYNAPLATHFYTTEEIRKFRSKWERNPIETP